MNAAPHMLSRSARRPAQGRLAAQRFLEGLTLAPARVHEFCGSARHTLALTVARAMTGPVLWVRSPGERGQLCADAVLRFIDPARLVFASPRRQEDTLWAVEEALRSGAAPLVVGDLHAPPGLTPVRRLHLAAETGAREGAGVPLGLLLTPGDGGAPGVESRWALEPEHTGHRDGDLAWILHRRRARTEPVKSWPLRWGDGGLTISDASVHEKITRQPGDPL